MSAVDVREKPFRQPLATRSWPRAVYLALLAIPFAVWEGWTLIAWATDSPRQITEYREGRNFNWYATHTLEVLCIIFAIVMLVHIVRDCRRRRRIFTFDVLFLLACSHIWWITTGLNGYMPVWLPSSNFINLNDPCGHMPFVVNPDCGRIPNPVILAFISETFGPLALAMVAEAGMRRARRRWPGIATPRLVTLVIGMGVLFVLKFEGFVMVPLKLWTFAAPSAISIPWHRGFYFPVTELVTSGVWIGMIACLRAFKDDHGRTFVERGIDRYSERARTFLTFAALYGTIQFLTWTVGTVPTMLVGPYASAENFDSLPPYVLNGVCDPMPREGSAGTTVTTAPPTRYGPCPGTPGFRIPGRNSLEGEAP